MLTEGEAYEAMNQSMSSPGKSYFMDRWQIPEMKKISILYDHALKVCAFLVFFQIRPISKHITTSKNKPPVAATVECHASGHDELDDQRDDEHAQAGCIAGEKKTCRNIRPWANYSDLATTETHS